MPGFTSLRRLRRRLRTLLVPDAAERALDDELRFHLEMEVDHNVRLGLSPDDARRKAMRELGDPVQWHRDDGTVGGTSIVDGIARDVRLAARSLRRAPAFSLVAVATLALGIGITTAVFSAVDGVLLRHLPYPQPDRLVRIYERSRERDRIGVTGANFHDLRARVRSLRAMAFLGTGEATVLGADEPLRARVAWTSRDLFDVLAVRPERGRTARDAEGTPGGPNVAVVSRAFWERALGADPRFAERTLRIGDDRYPIVGVMPAHVQYPARADVWVTQTDENPSRSAHNWVVVGRLARGATVASAQTEVDGILRRIKAEQGTTMTADGGTVVGLHADMARRARTTLLVLLGAVGFVLLVACVNLASANLARGERRQQEFAVRAALGAGRGRIVRQVLTENLLLAAAGGALGVALAWGLTRLLVAAAPATLPSYASVRVDGRVLAFAAAASILTGLLVAVAPAWQVTRDLRGAIARGGRSGIDGARLRGRGVLIAAEVALALALLAGAGLLVRSLDRLLGEELGFEPVRVLAADVSLPTSIYSDTARIARYFDRLLPELRAIPGVRSVGLVSDVPLGGQGSNSSFAADGGTEWVGSADYRVADGGYFQAMGIPLLLGRTFGAGDAPGAEHAVIVNAAAARQFWPGLSPLGHRVRFPGMDLHAPIWLTVVGVVGDVRGDSPAQPAAPAMYVHYAQRPEVLARGAALVVRVSGSTDAVAAAVREHVRALDANVPVRLASMEEVVARATADRRFSTLVLSAFAALALALAALGIHGVLAYTVAQREREIGVRMALGAHRGAVRAMVLRDAMRAVLPGVALGVAGGLALSRLLRGMLYGVSAADPATFAGVAALLTGVALVAAWLPARRATRVDPMSAIRAE